MKKFALCAGLAAMAFTMLAALPRTACSAELSVSRNVAFVGRYIWRGQDLLNGTADNADNNNPALQPSITVSSESGLAFNVWGNYALDGNTNWLTELDYTVSYSGKLSDAVDYTVGHAYYTYPNSGESQETFAGVSFPKVLMQPAVFVYGDWGSDASKGWYVNVSGSYEIAVSGKQGAPALNLALSAGYSDGQWSLEPGVSDINASLSMPLKLGRVLSVTPSLNYTYVPGKGTKDAGDVPPKTNFENEFWGGLNFGFDLK